MKKNLDCYLEKTLGQITGQEILSFWKDRKARKREEKEKQSSSRRYVYGIRGIMELFDCSKSTANRIKQSGKIDAAIKQVGRKIIVDAELALELAGKRKGGGRR
ncbi:MAG: DUF3853 family protein [Dysgonomonas sp.]